MNLKHYLPVHDNDHERFEDIYKRYRQLSNEPETCVPMIIVNTPLPELPSWRERLADPMVMLQAELDSLRPHLEIGDDRVPTVRVQFGTAQIAAAFGCPIHIYDDSLPCAGDHVLKHAEDVGQLESPGLDAGWYGKLTEWTEIWIDNLPHGISIQHPDIQSAFNSAHLIRGNDIFLDFHEAHEHLDHLLDLVTEFMIRITRHIRDMITDDPDWFFDWGVLWKGVARISNCSMQMISPQLYRDHVRPRDIRFMENFSGGRIHYCGTNNDVIDDFFSIPSLTGFDILCKHHDFFSICDLAPRGVVLMPSEALEHDSPVVERLLQGDWPAKRNIVILVKATSVEDGSKLLQRLRHSLPY